MRGEKTLNHYFELSKQLPLVLAYDDVVKLVQLKGVSNPPPKTKWWNLNILIMSILSIAILSIGIIFSNSKPPIKTKYSQHQNQINLEEENFIISKAPVIVDTIVHEKTIENTFGVESNANQIMELPYEEDIEVLEKLIASPSQTLPTFIDPSTAITNLDISKIELEMNSMMGDTIDNGTKKIIIEKFDLEDIEWFKIRNSKGDIRFHIWENDYIEFKAIVDVVTRKEENEVKAIEDFELTFEKEGSSLGITSNWEDIYSCMCSSNSKKDKVKTKEGEKIAIKKLNIVYDVYLPSTLNIDVSNSYADTYLPSTSGELKASIFKGDLIANDFIKDFYINQRYGKTTLKNYVNGEVKLFKGKAELGIGSNLVAKANYSELLVKSATDVNLNSFQSDVEFNKIDSLLISNFRYGDLIVGGTLMKANVVSFKGKLEFATVEDCILNLSYSNLDIEKVNFLDLQKAFQSNLNIIDINAIHGKLNYSPVKIGFLKEAMSLSTFHGKIKVKNTKNGFKLLKLDSKYTELDFSFNSNTPYQLDVTSYSAGINLPKENFSTTSIINSNNKSVVSGYRINQNADSKVNMNLFQGSLTLR